MAEDEHILPCPISYIRRNVKTPKRQDTCLADIDSTVSDWVHSPWSLWFWASSGACEWPPSDLYFPMTCRKAGKGLKLEKTGTHCWENGVHGPLCSSGPAIILKSRKGFKAGENRDPLLGEWGSWAA
ncbi:hypothetical protein NC652_007874 [Populus alba x Populus x berolinensis]|nr:hypothetical protein NC652_007874 [Populus alba x Populus x berolinensis]